MISPKGSQLAPLNEASCNRRIGLKLSGQVSIVMRRSHRRVKSLEIGRLPHDVVARKIPAALLESLDHGRRLAEAASLIGVDELSRRQVFGSKIIPCLSG
jgi:hypothetical protein